MRLLAPVDQVLALVGAPVSGAPILTMLRHPRFTGSWSEVNAEAECHHCHLRAGRGALHASRKCNGASAASFRDGRLVQAVSQGVARWARNITFLPAAPKSSPTGKPQSCHDEDPGSAATEHLTLQG